MAADNFKKHLADGLWESDMFSQAVETIYNETSTGTTSSLRDTALGYITQHASELLKSDTDGTPTALAKVMDTISEFSKDIAMRLLSENETLKSATPSMEESDKSRVIGSHIQLVCGWCDSNNRFPTGSTRFQHLCHTCQRVVIQGKILE